MKVLVAGATGALGRQLVPRLVAAGHEVTGTTRSIGKAALLEEWGARAAVLDALDADSVAAAVAAAEPDVIVHQLTALDGVDFDPRKFEAVFAQTNRLRTEGTDHLLAAGRAVGVRRFVAQSFTGWPFAREGGPVKTEDDPLDPAPPAQMRSTLDAIRRLETTVLGATWTDGIVLRYGGFYGPGTSLAPDGEMTEQIRKRRLPVIGDGGGIWSFVHIGDAADATVAAVEHGTRGIYQVVDDEPARVAEWLPAVASALGAKPPRRLPRFLGRVLGGEVAMVMMSEMRGASNARAKAALGWRPEHPTWRGTLGVA
jgi:nucleoside-diphosphate-sugar epimerase